MLDIIMGVAYSVSNVQKSVDFYGKTLGLRKLHGDDKNWAEFAVGEKRLYLFDQKIAQGKSGTGGAVMFLVSNIGRTVSWLNERGVKVEPTMDSPGGGHAARFADPDGNLIGLFEAPR